MLNRLCRYRTIVINGQEYFREFSMGNNPQWTEYNLKEIIDVFKTKVAGEVPTASLIFEEEIPDSLVIRLLFRLPFLKWSIIRFGTKKVWLPKMVYLKGDPRLN